MRSANFPLNARVNFHSNISETCLRSFSDRKQVFSSAKVSFIFHPFLNLSQYSVSQTSLIQVEPLCFQVLVRPSPLVVFPLQYSAMQQ